MTPIYEVCKGQHGLLGEHRFGSGQLIGRAGAGERHIVKSINCLLQLDFASLTPSIIARDARLRVPMCLPHMNYLLQVFATEQVGVLLLLFESDRKNVLKQQRLKQQKSMYHQNGPPML